MTKKTLLIISFLSVFALAQAHEFWLAFDRFIVNIGERVSLTFLVGEDFTGERWKGTMKSFDLYRAGGKQDLRSLFPKDTTQNATFTFEQGGGHLFVFESENKYIELEADKFLAYLEEDGLEEVIALRKERKEENKIGKEQYQRCAKSLVQVGKKTDNTALRVAGLPLEISPVQHPYRAKKGSTLQFSLTFRGVPMKGHLVKIWHRKAGKVSKTEQKTDAKGYISFPLDREGQYMVSAVKMIPYPEAAQADWQSYWASFTFGF